MSARHSPAAPSPWMLFVLVFAFSLLTPLTPPAFADDNARANRLMVEAVGLVAAAEREPSAQERFRLLQRAHELLLDIVERHPSTDLAAGGRRDRITLPG